MVVSSPVYTQRLAVLFPHQRTQPIKSMTERWNEKNKKDVMEISLITVFCIAFRCIREFWYALTILQANEILKEGISENTLILNY